MQITKRVIKKIELTSGRTLKIKLKEHLSDGTVRDVNYDKCDQLYHDDAKNAFAKLIPHFALICDLRESDAIIDEQTLSEHELNRDLLENISVDGLIIKGSDDNEGFEINGYKTFKNEMLEMSSPVIDVDSSYEYFNQLALIIEQIRFEANAYLFDDKYAIKQQELPFEETDPDSGEFNQQASEVAGSVLAQVGEKILNDIDTENVTITISDKGKKGKKGKNNIITMTSVTESKAEVF
jgi:hypothetical protein